MELFMGVAITSIVGSWAGSFLGAYLKKKGENLATHEDVDKIVSQVAAVTRATKEIESKIDRATWDRQKQWELKREVLFEVTKQTALAKDALTNLYGIYNAPAGKPERLDQKVKVALEWQSAAQQLNQTTAFVSVVCRDELHTLLLHFGLFCRNFAQRIFDGDTSGFQEAMKELNARLNAIRVVTRQEAWIGRRRGGGFCAKRLAAATVTLAHAVAGHAVLASAPRAATRHL
jgi:hypothetical protein